ncbi:MAG: DegT/DnrJ/EryC1/StrS family aminotransferase [Chloroflexi bacterium]|nr:MAG: erythromycin biosynthesis sensory transduction protein eryC1 [Phototrophicales bacterium]RMF81837.1 MAG: DegT/DnrJ/EryC1/StrS family aminotransferase [Chloroflexota bacterium]
MEVPFVDLRAEHAPLLDEMKERVGRILEQGNFILGDEVEQLEEEFAAYCDVKHAVGVDSGASALKLLLIAYGIGEGDEVIIPANTFIATAGAVTFAGATPVLVDIAPNTYNIDVNAIEAAITPRTKAIMPVHLYGTFADMTPILDLAARNNLLVIEDAAQAHGATYNGQRAGSLAQGAGFSFYPAKNLGAGGDAGMVTTNNSVVADQIRAMRHVGQRHKYIHDYAPFNHRLDTVQAAILRIKLRYLDANNAARCRHAALYNQLFAEVDGVITPEILPETEAVWHLYVIRTTARDELQAYLREFGIASGVHYPVPIHLQPYYENLGYRKGDFPITEEYADQILSLPMFPNLTEEQIHYVVDTVKAFVEQHKVEAIRI